MASRLTGMSTTADQIAESLGEDTGFIKTMAEPLAEDDESAVIIRKMISITNKDVEEGYKLLFDSREALEEVVGKYADVLSTLPLPDATQKTEEPGDLHEVDQTEDLDRFEDFDRV